jgi:hypothetical protein
MTMSKNDERGPKPWDIYRDWMDDHLMILGTEQNEGGFIPALDWTMKTNGVNPNALDAAPMYEFLGNAIKCVNACAGMHDPAAEIEELRKASIDLKSIADELGSPIEDGEYIDMMAALPRIATLKKRSERLRSLREWVDNISEMLRPGKNPSVPLNEERILELLAKEDNVEILQGGMNEAQKFVQESEYFDGTAAGACVVKTAVEYGRRYKQRHAALEKEMRGLSSECHSQQGSRWVAHRINGILIDNAAPAPPPPDPVQGFKKLSEAAGGRFDGVDVEEYVRAVRYGEKPKRPAAKPDNPSASCPEACPEECYCEHNPPDEAGS